MDSGLSINWELDIHFVKGNCVLTDTYFYRIILKDNFLLRTMSSIIKIITIMPSKRDFNKDIIETIIIEFGITGCGNNRIYW